jgi:hypothetical protein
MNRFPRGERSLGRAPRRLFGGYGPLLAMAVAFVLVVTLVPTVGREQIVVTAQSGDPTAATRLVPVAGRRWQDRRPRHPVGRGPAPEPR